MLVSSVSVTYSRKVNLGNYESVDATVFLSAVVEEGDDLKDVLRTLSSTGKEAVYQALESELSDELKVTLNRKIAGKQIQEQAVVKVGKQVPEEKVGLKSSVWDKFVDQNYGEDFNETDDDDDSIQVREEIINHAEDSFYF